MATTIKKTALIVLSLVFSFSFFAGCKPKVESVKIGAMNGPTMIGLGELNNKVNTKEETRNNYSIEKVLDAGAIGGKLAKGDYDIAMLPSNAAANLFNNKKVDMVVVAINTLNVLYLLDNTGEINSIADLAGKKVYSAGKGATPEHVFNYLLKANNVTGVDVQFEADASFLAGQFQNGTYPIVLLPQPAATVADPTGTKIKLDLLQEWQKIEGMKSSLIVTGVTVATKDFATNNKAALDDFLLDYKESITFMAKPENLDTAAQYVVDMGIIPNLVIAKTALPLCGLTYLDGLEMKTQLSNFLSILMGQNANSIGGKLPEDAFYYQA